MAKQELIIFVGNIGCGKSTIAREYVSKGYVAIARDQLRYAIGEGEYIWDDRYEPIIWATEQFMFKGFCNLGINIVVDEINVSRRMRGRYTQYSKLYGYKVKAIVMPRLSMEESVSRRMKDPHGQEDIKVWEQVWARFDKIYEKPTLEEGFDEIIKLKK